MPTFKIFDEQGAHINTIVADLAFVQVHFPDRFEEIATPLFTWDTVVDGRYWWIGVGAFYDRFAGAKIAVLARADPTIQAMVRDTQIRQYIDLKRTDVGQLVAYIAEAVPELTEALADSILNAPTTDDERFVKGLPQPADA
ncbi:hypothetical protein CEK29_07085 [Bordetella genomosp. 5]|uniref:hypothetical protein n=1 Tax=Bordetella genomosp. 5 TaxID=1395608 RepID=UPI000B9EC24B|nr:hypothetical protein [Bordetella genomosp. 5]OZI44489.1 hypothetical protein CEK29_07085 [Bordetella genomosp. 5]